MLTNRLLRRLLNTLFMVITLIAVTGCQKSLERDAARTQGDLDEADLLIEVRRFDQAQAKAREALDKLNRLLEKSPGQTDLLLLKARAFLTLFMSENVLVIENAKILPRSLVRLPEAHEYRDYDATLVPALEILRSLLNSGQKLTLDHQGYVHGMLAAILRLDAATAKEADNEYAQAVGAYVGWLKELRTGKPLVGSNMLTVKRLENQVRGLLMARAEVNLLEEDWQEALMLLREVMADEDLKYFEMQLPYLEEKLAEVQHKLTSDERLTVDPRVERLNMALAKTRRGQLSYREKVAAMDPYQAQLTQVRIELAETQNNLMYRIICYRNLGEQERFDEARRILRISYPELDDALISLLNR